MVVPLIYRVYRATVQRVTVSMKNFNSNAVFIIVIEEEKRITLWLGSQSEDEDAELAESIAETIMKRDFREGDEEPIPTILEGEEVNDVLEPFLDMMCSTLNQYYSKMAAGERKKALVNSSVSVGYIEPMPRSIDTFDFQETAFAHPDVKGTVPRVPFVPIEMNTIAYVNVGDHWDIWCARAVPDEEIERVMVFVRNTVATQLNLVDNVATRQTNVLGQYVQLIRQGEEGTLFRRPLKIFTDFEPPGKCAPRPDPAPRMKKEVERKAAALLAGKLNKKVDRKDGAGNDNEASGMDSKADEEEEGFAPRQGIAITASQDSFGGGPSSLQDGAEGRRAAVDFWSVPTGDTAAQGGEEMVYPPINVTVTIKNKDGVFGIDPDSVDADMLRVVETANDNPSKRAAVVEEAERNPRTLLGYQVEIDDGVYAGVFVVAQVKKTLLHKTMFHLCALDNDRFWVRLRRGKKGGVAFRPLRRVVRVSFVEPGKDSSSKHDSLNKPVDHSHSHAAPPSPSTPSSPVTPYFYHANQAPLDDVEHETAQYEMILNDFAPDE